MARLTPYEAGLIDNDDFARQPRTKLDRLLAQKDALEDKIAKELTKPIDDFEDGAVITYTKQFQRGGVTYTYAAVKVNGYWYTTATTGRTAVQWDELLDFIDGGELWYATEWERVQ